MRLSSVGSLAPSQLSNVSVSRTSATASVFTRADNAAVNVRWSVLDYLNHNPDARKVLIVGCGMTPESVIMGSGHTAIPGISCSLGRRHSRDFTIDVSPDATADLTIDLVTYRGTELGIYGQGRFDAVEFEYINRGVGQPFSSGHIGLWINAANQLLKLGGKIVFYSGDSGYREIVKSTMTELGYKAIERSIPRDGSPGNRYGHIFCEGEKRRL